MINNLNPLFVPQFLIGALFLVIGAFYLLITIRDYLEAKNSSNWPYVIGTIISSQIKEKRSRLSPEDSYRRFYRAEVRYAYNVNGVEYSSKRVKAGINISNTREVSAEKTFYNYPEGKSIRVYYNSRSPKKSFLETGSNTVLLVNFIVSFLIIIIGLVPIIIFLI